MKLFLLVLVLLCIPFVLADWTPQGDINLRGVYEIKNATNVTAEYFCTDDICYNVTELIGGTTYYAGGVYIFKNGSNYFYMNETKLNATISALDTTIGNCSGDESCSNIIYYSNISNLNVNRSGYWDNLNSINATQMENSGGYLNILQSWLTGLFYKKAEIYNTSETYTRTQIDNNFSLYYLASVVNQILSGNLTNYMSITSWNTNLTSINQNINLNHTEAKTYSNTILQNNLTLYYNKTDVDNNLSSYLLLTDQTYNETDLIKSVNKTTNIMSLGFYNKSEIETNFSLFYIKTLIDDNFSLYYVKTAIDSNFSLYYLKTEVDNNFSLYYVKTAIDNNFSLYYLKTEVDNNLSNYILTSEEGNLNVNGSDYWDNYGTANATQMENSEGVLNILQSWLTGLFYKKTEVYNQSEIDDQNTSMVNYIDARDEVVNQSARDYTDSKLITEYFNATAIQVVTGTGQGELANIIVHNGDSYNVSEVDSDFDLRVNFTGVEDFNQVIYRYKTEIDEPHMMHVNVWDYDLGDWGTLAEGGSREHFGIFTYPILCGCNHSAGGIVQLRFYTTNGPPQTTHKWQFDWVAISDGPATPSSAESDPFSVRKDGTIPLTANWDQGAFNFTNTDSWFKGKVNYSSIQNHPADSDSLDGNASSICADAEVLLGNGTCWDATNFPTDTDTTYTNGSAISLVGNQFNLTTCGDNEVWKMNGAVWNCEADAEGAGGTGFTTDQNDELNTTGGPTFVNVTVQAIYGDGDSDTYINWSGTEDQLELFAGGLSMVHLVETDGGDTLVLNQDSNDIDFRVESDNLLYAFVLDGATGRIRMENLSSCDTIDTDSDGYLSCGTDDDTTYTAGSNISFDGTKIDLDTSSLKDWLDTIYLAIGNAFSGAYADLTGKPTHLSNFTDNILWTSGFNGTGDGRWNDTQWVRDQSYLTSYSETDPRFVAWDNITGIPHATPSDGDTTHFSLADEIYDYIVGLNIWDSSTDLDNVIATDEITELKIDFNTACAPGNHLYVDGNNLACESDADTTYLGGNAITLDSTTFNFDGGASPSGELGGSWASPTVDSGIHDDEYEPISSHFDANTTTNITCLDSACKWYTNATDSCMYWPSGGKDCGAA